MRESKAFQSKAFEGRVHREDRSLAERDAVLARLARDKRDQGLKGLKRGARGPDTRGLTGARAAARA